jgi:peptidoglycan/LPS O-acetylase OafA/YrhL
MMQARSPEPPGRGALKSTMSSKPHIHTHTALRGIAALLVVGYHLQFGDGHRLALETATAFFVRGYLWVDLFFLLSGFVISYTMDADRRAPLSTPQIGTFIGRRLARIYPLHLFCLLVLVVFRFGTTAGLLLIGRNPSTEVWGADSLGQLALQLVLLHAWGFTSSVGWNIPSWSISAELFAYLIFPLLVFLHVRLGALARLGMLVFATAFMVEVARTTGSLDLVANGALLRCVAGFMLGMLVYLERARFAVLGVAVLSLLQAVSAVAILAGIALRWNDALLVPFFAVLVGSTWTDRGLLPRLLVGRPLLTLGEISYSVYLTHIVVIDVVRFFWLRVVSRVDIQDDVARTIYIALVVAVTLAVSSFTYRRVEVPARIWLSAHLSGGGRRVVPEPAPGIGAAD